MFLVNNKKLSGVTGIGDQVEKQGIVEITMNGCSDDPQSIFLCPSGCGCTRYFSCGCGPGPLGAGRGRETNLYPQVPSVFLQGAMDSKNQKLNF
jgi:hypothetical protein